MKQLSKRYIKIVALFMLLFAAKAQAQRIVPIGNPDGGNGYKNNGAVATIVYGSNLFMQYQIAGGNYGLAKYDGSSLTLISNPSGMQYSGQPIVYGSNLYLYYGNQLGQYNGSGVTLISNPSGTNYNGNPITYGSNLYLNFRNANGNNQLTKFDGTNITLIDNPDADGAFTGSMAGGNLGNSVVYGSNLYFQYSNPNGNFQLAKYNGSSISLVNNPDGNVHGEFGGLGYMGSPVVYGSNLYFQYQPSGSAPLYKLAKYDGSSIVAIDNPDGGNGFTSNNTPIVYNSKLYFQYQNASGINQLAQYDGTSITLIDNPDGGNGYVGSPIAYAGSLYIRYQNAIGISELAQFDGTELNLVGYPDGGNGYMGNPIVYNSYLYFQYNNASNIEQLAQYDGSNITIMNNPDGGQGYQGNPLVYNSNLFIQYLDASTNYQLAEFDGSPNFIWTGATSSTFSDASNWTNNLLPATSSTVTIPSIANNQPALIADDTLNGITLNGTLNINGHTLTCNGAVIGSGYLMGSTTSNFVIGGTGGTINFLSTANTLNNFTINSGTVTLSNALNVHGTLTPTGTLMTGDNLTLKSTSITSSAVVGVVGGGVSGNVTVERYIPKGYRAYRDMAPEVYNTSNTLYNTWQESGSLAHNGYGIFITASDAVDPSSSFTSNQPAPSSNGIDYSLNGIQSAFIFNNSGWSTGFTQTNSASSIATGLLDPYQSYRVLVRGDRSFNMATTPIMNYPAGLRMVNATVLRATGSLIYGDVTYSASNVANTQVTGTDANVKLNSTVNSFSMVCNPYVIPVLWGTGSGTQSSTSCVYGASIAASSGGINGSFWYLDPTAGETGNYLAFNALTGSSISGASSSYIANYSNAAGYIQPGQAFFIEAATTTPEVVFKETTKGVTSNLFDVFGVATPLSKIYISLEKLKGSSYTLVDGSSIAFSNGFGNTIYGNQDAHKISNGSDNLYISDKGTNLSIDGRLPATASDKLALALGQLSATTYQLKFDATTYTSNGFTPSLFDSYKNTITAISGVDSISFTVDMSIAASYVNRFSIIFQPNALAVNSIVASASLSNKVATITWNTVGEKAESYFEVEKSTDGKTFTSIGQQSAKNTTSANYTANDDEVVTTTAYYRIKAVSGIGSVNYSNIAKLTYDLRLTTYSFYPNPLTGRTLNVQLSNVAAGKYVVSIYNVLGQKVNEQSINHLGGSATHALTINKILAAGAYSIAIREVERGQLIYQTSLSVQK